MKLGDLHSKYFISAGIVELRRYRGGLALGVTLVAKLPKIPSNRSFTNVWAHYRITSFGEEGEHIELCLVKWPTFEDIDEVVAADKAVVVNPGDTGFASAYPNILTVLKSKWNIDHSDADLIGLRFREV